MPLPYSDKNTAWPPKQMTQIFLKMAQWSAWYSGDLQKLQAAYGGGDIQDSTGFFASPSGGFLPTIGRTLQRFFVGEPTRGPDRNTKLPIPIAAEICQASADLLFADPVTVTVGDSRIIEDSEEAPGSNVTQDRVDSLMNDSMHSTFAEAAEMCAALGGVYLRVTWDPLNYPDAPFVTIMDADQAIPEFTWGRLSAVTFWSVVKRDGKHVYRHLERHELDAVGDGVIMHGLYDGDDSKLGEKISLGFVPVTASLLLNPAIDADGTMSTLSPGLAVIYVPNQTPNRIWRTDPIGRNLGRSDLDGVEHLMDQLAEVMTAWMRAIRLAKARIFLAKELLKNAGPGNGNVGSLEQEAYTTINSLGGKDLSLADQIQLVQPKVEYQQYKDTAEALMEQILQMAGYSMQTFGVGDTGTVRTATEINSKERRSLMTRDRKIREWRPALIAILTKLLLVDNALFGGKNIIDDIDVEFNDGVQETPLALANTALALYTSESASAFERVSIMHPDWDKDDIDAEVELIRQEFAHPLPDPAMTPFEATSAVDTTAALK